MEKHPLIIPKEFQHIQPEKKAKILSSALSCLAHYGYHGASIKRIADYAGVSKALIYNYYSSKDELVKDLMNRGMEQLIHAFTPEGEPQSKEEASIFIDKMFEMMDASPHFWKVYFSILTNSDVSHLVFPILAEDVIPQFYGLAQTWEKFGINHSQEEFMFLASVLDGVCFNYLINDRLFPRDYAIKRIKQLFGFIN